MNAFCYYKCDKFIRYENCLMENRMKRESNNEIETQLKIFTFKYVDDIRN